MEITRLKKDGKVAVIVSPGYGAGWSTWAGGDLAGEVMFHPELALAIVTGMRDHENTKAHLRSLEKRGMFIGGWDQCIVMWAEEGTLFRVNEYDGSESIEELDECRWHTA